MEGYRRALRASDLDDSGKIVTTHEHSTVKLGGTLLQDLLSQHPEVDAVFCCNDDLAMGAIFEAQRQRISIPGEIAIAGFNDLEAAKSIYPSLTTLATPRYQIGKCAAELVLNRLEGTASGLVETYCDLGYEIIKRESA